LLIDDAIAAQLVEIDCLCARLERLTRLAREQGFYDLAADLRRNLAALKTMAANLPDGAAVLRSLSNRVSPHRRIVPIAARLDTLPVTL